jgi:hypothetical protein
VTEASSDHVIVDSTPPGVDHVAAGTTIDESFVSGPELSVHWEGVEDGESGILQTKVGGSAM